MNIALRARGTPTQVIADLFAQIKQARTRAPELSPALVLLRDAVCKAVRQEEAEGADEVEVKVETEVKADTVDAHGKVLERAPVLSVTGQHVRTIARPDAVLVATAIDL